MPKTAVPETVATRARVAVAWEAGLEAQAQRLAAELGLPLQGQGEVELLLALTPARLELREIAAGASGPVYADFVVGAAPTTAAATGADGGNRWPAPSVLKETLRRPFSTRPPGWAATPLCWPLSEPRW